MKKPRLRRANVESILRTLKANFFRPMSAYQILEVVKEEGINSPTSSIEHLISLFVKGVYTA